MKTLALLILLAFTLIAPVAAQTPTPAPCPPTTWLTPPQTARVMVGSVNNLRSSPTLTSRVFDQIQVNTPFQVIDGPVCADGLNWYWVHVGARSGWTAEGMGSVTWLQGDPNPPITPDNAGDLALLKSIGTGFLSEPRWRRNDLYLHGTPSWWLIHTDDPAPQPLELASPSGGYVDPTVTSELTDDGRLVVALENGQILLDVPAPDGLTSNTLNAVYQPRKRWVVTQLGQGLGAGGETILWNADTGEPIMSLTNFGVFVSTWVSFNEGGARMAVYNFNDDTLRVLDTETWTELFVINPILGSFATQTAFVGDGVCYRNDWGEVGGWRVDTDSCRVPGVFDHPYTSPDGSIRVDVARADGELTTITDVESGEVLDSFDDYQHVTGVGFTPDGRTLVIAPYWNGYYGSGSTAVTLWDVETREIRRTIPFSEFDTFFDIEFSPDGRLMVTTGNSSFQVWDTSTWEVITTVDDLGYIEVLSANFNDDGTLLAITGGIAQEYSISPAVVWLYGIEQ